MKKLILIFFSVLITTNLCAQKLKLSKKKENTRNGKAIFYTIKNQPSIKHGSYIIKSWGGKYLLVEGKYDNNKKVGEWVERYWGRENAGRLKSKGQYKDDYKSGVWNYYDSNGEKIQSFNHDNEKLLFSGRIKGKSDSTPAEYVGGRYALNYNIHQQISVPSELIKSNVHVFEINTDIKITIDINNSVKNIEFSNPIGHGVDDKLKKWILDSNNQWVSATKENINYEASIVIPLKYKMMF